MIRDPDCTQCTAFVHFRRRGDVDRAVMEMQHCILVPENAQWQRCKITLSIIDISELTGAVTPSSASLQFVPCRGIPCTRTRQRRTRREMRIRAPANLDSVPTVLTFVHEDGSELEKQPALAVALAQAHKGSALDPNNTTVFVGSLMSMASENLLQSLFSSFGPILTINIPKGQDCGFVQFARKGDAAAAIATMQNYPLFGGFLRLSWGRSINEKTAARAAARAGLRWVEDAK